MIKLRQQTNKPLTRARMASRAQCIRPVIEWLLHFRNQSACYILVGLHCADIVIMLFIYLVA
jgi:hypothetical protein